MANFASRLVELRKSSNITQQQLSNALNISRATIGMYEIGKRDPEIDTLIKLADYFNVTLDFLVCRTDETSRLPTEALREMELFKEFLNFKYKNK